MTIALRRDAATGKQNIVVKLDSDADALPIEHEQLHRTLIEKLLGQGIAADVIGELIIERESSSAIDVSRDAEALRSGARAEGRN